MKQENYQCSITVPVSAEEAFEGINHVDSWWAKHLEGYSGSIHDIFTVRFGKTFVTFEIVEMIPNQRIVWMVTDCYLPFVNDKQEWNGTSIIWEITETGDGTRIDMTHRGLVPEVECFTNCQGGWNRHIKTSLVKYLTESVGMPS